MKLFNLSYIARKVELSKTALESKIRRVKYNKLSAELITKIETLLLKEVSEFIDFLKSTIN